MHTKTFWAFLIAACVMVFVPHTWAETPDPKDPPTTVPTPESKARQKFDDTVARADKACNDAIGGARSVYLEGLQQALDAAMNSANLEDAKWARDEITRIKAGKPATQERAKATGSASAQIRFARAAEKAMDDRKRALELARRQYITDLESAKRAALSESKNLDEATRIAGEIERVKAMEFPAPGGEAGGGVPRPAAPTRVNLLKLVDTEHDAITYGHIAFEKTALVITGDAFKAVRFPYQPPTEYDFTADITILELRGYNDLILHASTGERPFVFNTGAHSNKISTIWSIPGGNEPKARTENILVKGQRVSVCVKVRAGGVAGWIGDKEIVRVDADLVNLQFNDARSVGLRVLGIGTYNDIAVHAAEVVEISGQGKVIQRLDAGQMRAQAQAFRGLRIGKSVSLTELRPRSTQVGWGRFRVNQNDDDLSITVNGKECRQYLYAHAPSSLVYEIPEGAIGFRVVGVRAGGMRYADKGDWRLGVTVDDREVFLSRGIKEENEQIPVQIPLPKGARFIELRADPLGDNFNDRCIWANPEFVFGQ